MHKEAKPFAHRAAAVTWVRHREVQLEDPTALIQAQDGTETVNRLPRVSSRGEPTAERVDERYMTAAVDLTELAHGTVRLDAAVIARDLGLEPEQVLGQLRTGRLAARCEQGIGEDAGRFRKTFLQENRGLSLIVDRGGRILERSTVRQSTRRAAGRRPASDP